MIWLDGGIGGLVLDDPSPGQHSGVLDFSDLGVGAHYFTAYVTAADDGTLAFAYLDPAPEPGTWSLVSGGMLLALTWMARRMGRVLISKLNVFGAIPSNSSIICELFPI